MNHYIEEELTLEEFAKQYAKVEDFTDAEIYDLEGAGIEVLTLDPLGNEVYKPIKSFVVKDPVGHYYTDGKVKVTGNHKILEDGRSKFAKDHPDFERVVGDMNVCDIEVADLHSFLANGRLHHNTTSGGKALAFHSSIRVRLKHIGQIKMKIGGKEKVVGISVRATIVKNRLGPPLRSADFDILFDRGIDNYGSWLSVLKEYNLVKQAGAWYEILDESTGELVRFQSKDYIEMMESNKELRDQIYKQICENVILSYKKSTTDIDELTLDPSIPGELD